MRLAPRRRLLQPACLLGALVASACASQAEPGFAEGATVYAAETPLELAPPRDGFQVASQGALVEPGDDVRWCETLRLPGSPNDVYYVDRIEAALAPGARDLIVSEARVGSETDALMEVGVRVPCTRAGETF